MGYMGDSSRRDFLRTTTVVAAAAAGGLLPSPRGRLSRTLRLGRPGL